jgi:hypothetical protein
MSRNMGDLSKLEKTRKWISPGVSRKEHSLTNILIVVQ